MIFQSFLFFTVLLASSASYAMTAEEMEIQLFEDNYELPIHSRTLVKQKFMENMLNLSEQTRTAQKLSTSDICAYLIKWNTLRKDLTGILLDPVESNLTGLILHSIQARLQSQL